MNLRLISFLLALSLTTSLRADDWPQWLGPKRDGVWRETGIIQTFPKDGPRILWRTPISAGYSGPAVADGRVYVTDRVAAKAASGPFERGKLPGVERVLCLDAKDGSVIWKEEYPCEYTISYASGPRATPAISDGLVYTIGAEGDLRCYTADKGKFIWSRKFNDDGSETPMWGYSASPLVDGDKLICTASANNIVMAYDKKTGNELWSCEGGKEPGYCPPVIHEAGGKRQLIIWHPAALVSLDPETGGVYWKEKREAKMGLSIAMPVKIDNLLLISSAYEGATMMQLDDKEPAAKRLWHRGGRSERTTDAIHILMPTPLVKDGHIYGVEIYGQLRCLKAQTGDRVWETFAATTKGEPLRWATAFLTANEDRTILFNDQGELIIARLSPGGYQELSRAKVIAPTNKDANRPVVWSPPAFANRCAFIRNDKEIVCVSMAAE